MKAEAALWSLVLQAAKPWCIAPRDHTPAPWRPTWQQLRPVTAYSAVAFCLRHADMSVSSQLSSMYSLSTHNSKVSKHTDRKHSHATSTHVAGVMLVAQRQQLGIAPDMVCTQAIHCKPPMQMQYNHCSTVCKQTTTNKQSNKVATTQLSGMNSAGLAHSVDNTTPQPSIYIIYIIQ